MCPDFLNLPRRTRGFSLVTAIFLLVVLTALGAFLVTFSTTQHQAATLDLQGARALAAARAGIEWGAYQVLKVPGFVCGGSDVINFSGVLAGFTATVSCSATTHAEGAATVTSYVLISTARFGTVGTPNYVERQLRTVVAK